MLQNPVSIVKLLNYDAFPPLHIYISSKWSQNLSQCALSVFLHKWSNTPTTTLVTSKHLSKSPLTGICRLEFGSIFRCNAVISFWMYEVSWYMGTNYFRTHFLLQEHLQGPLNIKVRDGASKGYADGKQNLLSSAGSNLAVAGTCLFRPITGFLGCPR